MRHDVRKIADALPGFARVRGRLRYGATEDRKYTVRASIGTRQTDTAVSVTVTYEHDEVEATERAIAGALAAYEASADIPF